MAAEVKIAKARPLETLRRLGPAMLVVLGILSVGGVIFIVSGVYNVAARRDHWPITTWVITVLRDRAVVTAAVGISVPELEDGKLADLGAEHYRGSCAACHGVPGQGPNPVYQKMLPAPPDLISARKDYNSKELFWIIYNGLKFTGMPAWPGDRRSDEVWALVAFLDRLRREGADSYTRPQRPRGALPPQLEAAGVTMELMESCVRCHGNEESLPISDRVPRLHGQSEAYLIRALENYGDGTRESGIMKPIAYEMSSEETAALASYYASLSLPDAEPLEDPAAVARGRQIAKEGVAEGGIPPCSSCHRGDNPQFPKLAGQSAAYLRGQLELWGKGLRDRSGYGAIMAVVAKRLTPAQIRDVTAFYASQPSALSAESRVSAP